MPADVTVLLVGAGPTGLLLTSELHRRRVVCRHIDAQPAPLHWDRATVVLPRSLEVFESLGLLEPFLAAGVKQRFARLHSAGRVLGEIDLSICGSRYGFNLGIRMRSTSPGSWRSSARGTALPGFSIVMRRNVTRWMR